MISAGQTINNTYEIIEQLGSGGGGIVYKAYHKRMQKYVAIKLIKDEIKRDINNRSEVDMLKNLKNDYLPQMLDFVEDGEDVYTVMEFIEGKDFKQVIDDGRIFDERSVRKYAIQLCSAVHYLHSQNPPVIHSDIKPANIMLTPKGNICLIDFNISVLSDDGAAPAIGGSRNFAAPEQFRRIIKAPVSVDEFHEETRFMSGDETEILLDSEHELRRTSSMKTKNIALAYIDARTDIYGIGATLYHLLTARTPVNGHIDFRGIPCSSHMKNIITKAMNPNPEKRFQSASEMGEALTNNSYKTPKTVLVSALALIIILVCAASVLYFNNNDDIEILSGSVSEIYSENDLQQAAVTEFQTEATASVSKVTYTETTAAVSEAVTETTVKENTINMPPLIGKDIKEATQILNSIGLSCKITYSDKQYEDVEENCVYSQKPNSGTLINKNTIIELGVSTYKIETTSSAPAIKRNYSNEELETIFYKLLTDSDADIEQEALDAITKIYISTGDEKYSNYDDYSMKGKCIHVNFHEEFSYPSSLYTLDADYVDMNKIKRLTNLSEMYIYGYNIWNFNSIKELYGLESLYLCDANISNIGLIDSLTNLTRLHLNNNNISNISAIGNLVNLTELSLFDNNISNITAIKKLTGLKYLYLFDNKISDITPIANLTNLEALLLTGNNIDDITPIGNLTNLWMLYLGENNISDITAIGNLTALEYLTLGNNNISDITPIYNLTDLTLLDLSYNNINESDLSVLKKYLPNCETYF